MKKLFFLSWIPLLFVNTAIMAMTSSYASKQTANPLGIQAPVSKSKQFGVTMEERTSYINGYLFFNQLLNKHVFYELRGYYIHNFILATPTTPAGLPPITGQRNLDGTGGVGIFGYVFQVNSALTVMPFIREQYLTNTVAAYKDTAGNELDSDTFTSYLGLKAALKVNDVFSPAVQYFGGYQRSNLYGRGLFATSGTPRVYAWVSTLEFDFPYKITPSWILLPYLQWAITGNDPNAAAFAAPIKQSGATSTAAVYAVRLGYAFA